jgi:hypothetical protein
MQFIFDFHVFPEFLIVRRDVLLRSISAAGPFVFWAFLYTGRALAHADVVFMPKPFARVTAVSDDPRLQQGNSETMFQWDRYRGGVEYIASLAHAGDQAPLERRTALTEHINRFMLTRQKVSLRLHLNSGNFVEGYILYHRMAAYAAAPLDQHAFQELCKAAAIITAAAEAANFSLHPAVADPCIEDKVLMLLKPSVRERFVRQKQPDAGPVAYLRIDPSFPADLAPGDAVFDITDYIAQFV